MVGDKWTLLIVRDLVSGPRRFVELQRVLPGISTEQLRSRLNRMVADGMLTRKRYREVPPRVDYELTERSRELTPVLGELARWGYEWSWGPPRPSERVDIGAIFRLIPGLLTEGLNTSGTAASGTVALIVSDEREGQAISYLVTLTPGRASVSETSPDGADARLRGSTDAWIRALSPAGDRGGLRVTGDRELGHSLLDALGETRGVRADADAESANAL